MASIRTTIVALFAFAIALLPASGNAILVPSLVDMVMTGPADKPCCPSGDTQTCATHGDFKAAACALKCAALAGAVLPAMTVAPPYTAEGSLLTLAQDAFRTHVITPTHPPPI